MVIKVKKRNFLKKKKIKEIKNELGEYGELLENKKKVEILEAEPNSFILIEGEPHIIIIDGNRMDKVENHYFLGDKFHKDLLHKVVYLLIPIDLYDKGHFNRKDYLIWLKDNTSDIKNTTDSIYNILDNHFTN